MKVFELILAVSFIIFLMIPARSEETDEKDYGVYGYDFNPIKPDYSGWMIPNGHQIESDHECYRYIEIMLGDGSVIRERVNICLQKRT